MALDLRMFVAGMLLLVRLNAADGFSPVFVYSQRETPARSWIRVACDGEDIAEVRRGYFFAVNLPPGHHFHSIRDGVPVSVEVRPGSATFVRLDWNHDVRRPPVPALGLVPEEVAKREMRFLGYIQEKQVHSRAVSPTDPRPSEHPQFKTRTPE